jgi:putative colanic acid biosynthesis acetyltransferase WcaF
MSDVKIDLSKTKGELSFANKVLRFIWQITWCLCTGLLPRSFGAGWKRTLLRLFGAKIASTAKIYTGVKIYYPKNLVMEEHSTIAEDVRIYNVAPVHIGANSIISQGAYLCTSSHDISDAMNSLVYASIHIEDQCWIATDAFVGMGVTIGQGAVVGARAAVFKDVEPWKVVGGNPARVIKDRVVK